MLGAALHNIDARGLYAGVAQQVGQLRQVLVQGVKGPGKQVTKVVGEDLPGLHPGPGVPFALPDAARVSFPVHG